MLEIIIDGNELFDEETSTFYKEDDVELALEHSLLSLSKWESITNRPFLGRDAKTPSEIRLYIECMIVTPDCPVNVIDRLSRKNMEDVNEYIESTQSATTFGHLPEVKGRGETITSELIYYWMVVFNIPFQCETWHLNRLFSLIRICNIKNSKPKKMSRNELAARNKALNEKRRRELGTRG